MRLLIVSYEYPPLGGGGGVMIRTLARELAGNADIAVLTTGRAGLPARENDGGVSVVRVPVWGRSDDAVASLASLLSFIPSSLRHGRSLPRFDLVHSSFAVPSGPTGVLLAKRWGVPHVLTVHGGDVFDPSRKLSPHRTPILRETVRAVMRHSDRVVALSAEIEHHAREIYGIEQVTRIPPGVREAPAGTEARSALGFGDDEVVLVTTSRLVLRKGIDALVDVVGRLRELPLRLIIIGKGPLRGALEAQAAQLGLNQRISFAGGVSDAEKWRLLHAADLYVSTTHHEGFGIVFLEAMRAGLPVVTYDNGGQRDLIRNGEGILVPHGDREAFASAIARLAAAPDERARLAAAARARSQEYTVERFADRYLELYRDCVAASVAKRD